MLGAWKSDNHELSVIEQVENHAACSGILDRHWEDTLSRCSILKHMKDQVIIGKKGVLTPLHIRHLPYV